MPRLQKARLLALLRRNFGEFTNEKVSDRDGRGKFMGKLLKKKCCCYFFSAFQKCKKFNEHEPKG